MDLSIGDKLGAWIKPERSAQFKPKPQAQAQVKESLLPADAVVRPLVASALLTVLVVFSALSVIYSAFEYRRLFNDQQQLIQQWDEIQVEWGQLLLEQSALGANSRVEQFATQQLKMAIPSPDHVEIVQYER